MRCSINSLTALGAATLIASVLLPLGPVTAGSKPPYFGGVPDVSTRSTSGVSLSEVRPDSPAEKAGLRAGDIVVQLGGITIQNPDDFVLALRSSPPNKPVKVIYIRQDQEYHTEAVLIPRRLTSKGRGHNGAENSTIPH